MAFFINQPAETERRETIINSGEKTHLIFDPLCDKIKVNHGLSIYLTMPLNWAGRHRYQKTEESSQANKKLRAYQIPVCLPLHYLVLPLGPKDRVVLNSRAVPKPSDYILSGMDSSVLINLR